MRIIREYKGLHIWIGPWSARISWARTGHFGWREGDGPITAFMRRWWSGWHRWRDED